LEKFRLYGRLILILKKGLSRSREVLERDGIRSPKTKSIEKLIGFIAFIIK